MNFLSCSEMRMIRQDFNRLLSSPESCDIEFKYQIPAPGSTIDPVYGATVTTAWTDENLPCRAIQQFVHPRNVQILEWGILEVGDCIFYIDTDIDLTLIKEQNSTIVCNSQLWVPVFTKMKAFTEFLVMRFGNGQIAQVIPAKLKS